MTDIYAANCFQSDHVAQEDLQQIEDNFESLNSSFAGSSAPSNPVAGKPWFDTDVDQLYIRNKDNDQWLTIDFIPGTLMLFAQASAPLGWTKITTFADTAMLCISSDPNGTALGNGGSANPQSTHTHSFGAHTHDLNNTVMRLTDSGNYRRVLDYIGGETTQSAGAGSSGANTQPKYQEVIICEKD